MRFTVFLHMVGIGLWLGGAVAAVLLGGTVASEPEAARAQVHRLFGRLYAWLVAPGAMLAVGSGLALAMMVASAGGGERLGEPGVAAMQATGFLAGLIELFVSFPMSQRLARLADAGAPAVALDMLRRRVIGVTSAALLFLLVALYLGVVS
ncbi:MAG TPA: hypothetical protein VGA37_03445 [Gemmatimonadales bacterium]